MTDSSLEMVRGSNCYNSASAPTRHTPRFPIATNHSRGDDSLDLAALGAHQDIVLLDDAANQAETVVVGQDLEEVLDGLVGAGGLGDLGNNEILGVALENGRGQDGDQLGVLGQDALEDLEGLVGGLQALGLCGRRVL